MSARKTGASRLPASVIATAVAIPLALAAGGLAYLTLAGYAHWVASRSAPASTPASTVPRAKPTGPVALPAPSLDDRRAAVCRALVARLPAAVRDLNRRPVGAGPEQNAAYGDPAITLACGGPRPSVDPTAFLPSLSGVCWLAVQGATASTWTTVDREVPVTVTVPKTYDPPGQWVIEFSAAIGTAVPVSAARPSGCAASS